MYRAGWRVRNVELSCDLFGMTTATEMMMMMMIIIIIIIIIMIKLAGF
jgi:hypothetical protein